MNILPAIQAELKEKGYTTTIANHTLHIYNWNTHKSCTLRQHPLNTHILQIDKQPTIDLNHPNSIPQLFQQIKETIT